MPEDRVRGCKRALVLWIRLTSSDPHIADPRSRAAISVRVGPVPGDGTLCRVYRVFCDHYYTLFPICQPDFDVCRMDSEWRTYTRRASDRAQLAQLQLPPARRLAYSSTFWRYAFS